MTKSHKQKQKQFRERLKSQDLDKYLKNDKQQKRKERTAYI